MKVEAAESKASIEKISTDLRDHAIVIAERYERPATETPEDTMRTLERMAVYSAYVDKTFPHTRD